MYRGASFACANAANGLSLWGQPSLFRAARKEKVMALTVKDVATRGGLQEGHRDTAGLRG